MMKLSLSLLLVGFIASCSQSRLTTARQVNIDIPATYKEAASGENSRVTTGWLSSLQSPRLVALVREALANNQNLAATAARLSAAEETSLVARARKLPDITVGGGTSVNYDNFTNDVQESYRLNLNVSWEADVWGRLRNLEKAAYYDFASAVADFRSARLSLAANTARGYLNLISAQQQLRLAETTLESFKKNLRIIERNYTAGTGDARDLDVAFGRNNVASAERSLISRRLDRDEAARSLEVLLGRYPAGELRSTTTLPSLSSRVPVGLPSTLLERRPDITSAAADVYASRERVEAARKNLLPSLRLTAGVSNAPGSVFSRIFDPNFLLYTAAANLSQTIYGGGELKAQARQALENSRAELADYAQTALDAFREVESALATGESLARQVTFLETEVEKAAVAEKFAERSYIEGGNILSVLEAQRRVNSARAALIALRNRQLQNRIDLHLALGGSF